MTTRPPYRTHCFRCGTKFQAHQRVKNQRHPSLVCDGCGLGQLGSELGDGIEARWEAAGRPWLGS